MTEEVQVRGIRVVRRDKPLALFSAVRPAILQPGKTSLVERDGTSRVVPLPDHARVPLRQTQEGRDRYGKRRD